MPKSKDDQRDFENESLRGTALDKEMLRSECLGEVSKVQRDLEADAAEEERIRKLNENPDLAIAEYFSRMPPELLVGLPDAIKGLPKDKLSDDMKDILAGAQLALELHDAEEE